MALPKKLSLYDIMNTPPAPMQQAIPVQQPIQEPIQQPVQPQSYQRPVMNPAIEEQYNQNLEPKKQGFLAKYGFTPGVLTQIASGATALTGGDPYLASGLAQSGQQLVNSEQSQAAEKRKSIADYVKGIRGEQSTYDKAQAAAGKTREIQQAKQLESIEKQKAIEAETQGIPPAVFKREQQLRGEYTKSLGSFPGIVDSYGRIQASIEDPSAAGDLALIFNYMKMLDPGSTVREGEFANAENSASIPARIRAKYNKVMSGERLADEQRMDFADRADKLYSNAEDIANGRKEKYAKLAESYGLDKDRTLYEIGYTGKRENKKTDSQVTDVVKSARKRFNY